MAGVDWHEDARQKAAGVRRRALDVCVRNNGGYLAQACCAAETLVTLYTRVLRLGPSRGEPRPVAFPGVPGPGFDGLWGGSYNGDNEPSSDRFLLSPAHYALALYATLVEVGRLDPSALSDFNRDGSTLEMIGAEHSPGFEATTGSLGQALSVGVGQALARKARGSEGRVWVYLSDGEMQEGQIWEALQAASNFGLGNLGVYLDANGQQVDGPMDRVMKIEPIAEKVRAFGWTTVEVDGHDVEALYEASLKREAGKPLFVVCRTKPWQGLPSLRGRKKLHYIRFQEGEAEAAAADLGPIAEEVPS